MSNLPWGQIGGWHEICNSDKLEEIIVKSRVIDKLLNILNYESSHIAIIRYISIECLIKCMECACQIH